MKLGQRSRLNVEMLEDRSVPTVTASVVSGSLIIVGDATAASDLTITASSSTAGTTADTFTVVDGATTIGTFTGVTADLVLNLTNSDDTVAVDLGGLSTTGGIRANLGNGANSLTVDNGTVTGPLNVRGGTGADAVTLGATTALTVNGNARVSLGGSADDSLELGANATVNGLLAALAVEHVTLDAGSTVGKSADVIAGRDATTVDLNGTVTGSAVFVGSNQADTLNATGSIGGNLIAVLRGGDTRLISAGPCQVASY